MSGFSERRSVAIGRKDVDLSVFRFLITLTISTRIFIEIQMNRIAIAKKKRIFQSPPGFLSHIGRSLINPTKAIDNMIEILRDFVNIVCFL